MTDEEIAMIEANEEELESLREEFGIEDEELTSEQDYIEAYVSEADEGMTIDFDDLVDGAME